MISITETKAAEEKMPIGRRNDATRKYEPDYAVQRPNMRFEHRRPKRLLFQQRSLRRAWLHGTQKWIEDPASPSYISHAARRKDHLYRREDAPLARKQRRCLPAAEAAGSLFSFLFN